MKQVRWVLVVLVLSFCAGCKKDQHIIGQVGFVNSVAIDQAAEGGDMFRVSVSIPRRSETDRNKTLSAAAHNFQEAMINLTRQTDFYVGSGQIRSILFGEKLAKKNIELVVKSFFNNASIGARVKLLIVKGRAEDIFTNRLTKDPIAREYISRAMERLIQNYGVQEVNIHTFMRDFYDDGVDPFVPMIKIEKDEIVQDGLAIFRYGQMKYHLEPVLSQYLFILSGGFSGASLQLNLENPSGNQKQGNSKMNIGLEHIRNLRKIRVQTQDPRHMRATIKLQIYGEINDYVPNVDLNIGSEQIKLEKRLKKQFETEVQAMLKLLQQLELDPIGIGQYVRNQMSYTAWKALDWRKAYSQMDITCEADIRIKHVPRIY
ncbi:Ger(x)C family spore germination protein [Paenibacillus terrigena]|uniref:Ger(x)C family spore germination protein n=1 Tax=Paenibacillus terrigena TaxID=369333 RepID=UPI0003675EC6|nr:Ger(x)C family spore germination protein [Paenibacillus terrigena]